MQGNGGLYQYRLEIERSPASDQIRIGMERLLHEGKPLYECSAATGKAILYRDDHSPRGEYLFDWSVSGVAGLHERAENSKLRWFRDRMSTLLVVRPNPIRMGAESRRE